MPKRYRDELRRKVSSIVMAAGRPIAHIAADLGFSHRNMYDWPKQEPIAVGELPGLNLAFPRDRGGISYRGVVISEK